MGMPFNDSAIIYSYLAPKVNLQLLGISSSVKRRYNYALMLVNLMTVVLCIKGAM